MLQFLKDLWAVDNVHKGVLALLTAVVIFVAQHYGFSALIPATDPVPVVAPAVK